MKRDHLSQMVHNAESLGLSYGQYIARYHPINHEHEETFAEYKKKKQRSIPIVATCIKTGEKRFYSSAKEATLDGFKKNGISACLNGAMNQHHGWTFRRRNENDDKISTDS